MAIIIMFLTDAERTFTHHSTYPHIRGTSK